jgi:hypothetical protein
MENRMQLSPMQDSVGGVVRVAANYGRDSSPKTFSFDLLQEESEKKVLTIEPKAVMLPKRSISRATLFKKHL